jgi:hypothetical protein
MDDDMIRKIALLRGATMFAPSGITYVPYNLYVPSQGSLKPDALEQWDIIATMDNKIQQSSGYWYPADTLGRSGVKWTTPPVAIATDDMYVEAVLTGAWDSAAQGGPCLRVHATAQTYYALWLNNTTYDIRIDNAGSMSSLKTDTWTPSAGDTIRFQVVGTLISFYVNDVLVDSVTNAVIGAGNKTVGWSADGLGANNRCTYISAGDVSSFNGRNLAVFQGDGGTEWAWQFDNRYLTSHCFAGDAVMDGSASVLTSHNADVAHFIEIDFGEFRVPRRMRHNGASTTAPYDWQNVTVKTKVLTGDPWTTVASAVAMDNVGASGWKQTPVFDTIQPCQFVRVEIPDTRDASNNISTREIQFQCVPQP